jgi:hypothetical protein
MMMMMMLVQNSMSFLICCVRQWNTRIIKNNGTQWTRSTGYGISRVSKHKRLRICMCSGVQTRRGRSWCSGWM